MSKRAIRKRRHRPDFKDILKHTGMSPRTIAKLMATGLVDFGKADWLGDDQIAALEASVWP